MIRDKRSDNDADLGGGGQHRIAARDLPMANLKRSEIRFIDEIFDMGSGYVLDFSNKTFAEFFEDEFRVEIYQEKYQSRGSFFDCR
jgi:hypothetical protein